MLLLRLIGYVKDIYTSHKVLSPIQHWGKLEDLTYSYLYLSGLLQATCITKDKIWSCSVHVFSRWSFVGRGRIGQIAQISIFLTVFNVHIFSSQINFLLRPADIWPLSHSRVLNRFCISTSPQKHLFSIHVS